jgi:hypothetical protein
LSGHWKNRYTQQAESDNDLCLPVLPPQQIDAIMVRTQQLAEGMVGAGPTPQLSFDLEHLQVADYAAFAPAAQQAAIRSLQAADPIRSEDLAYLALRSMIDFHWPKPKSEQDIRRAAAYDWALEKALREIGPYVAKSLARPEAPMPYWGRLGFLRVMTGIPDEQIEAQQLERFACVLIKRPAFNAHSFQHPEYGLIGLNFALEPILKSLNRMLLHFFHSQQMAGPTRMARAWASLVPVVLYFRSKTPVAANRLAPRHLLFDEDAPVQAHALTASQIDFIVRHELGHLVMEHARRLSVVWDKDEAKALQHEFEFAADAFAQSSLRSLLYTRLRWFVQWPEGEEGAAASGRETLAVLHDHQREVSGVRLLFAYMEVVDQIGELLQRRLGDAIAFSKAEDSHPPPRERIARLDSFQLGEYEPTSELLRYAQNFFADLLTYAESLNDTALAKSLQE